MRRPPTALAVAFFLPLLLSLSLLVLPVPSGTAAPSRSAAEPTSSTRAARSPVSLTTVLRQVNRARATARTCGDRRYPAVPPLRRNARLDRASDGFAHLMARRDFFSHDSPDGSSPGDRISAAGYRWSRYGENIAAGYTSAQSVVKGWLASPGHCSAIMGRYRHIGLGYAFDDDSSWGSYWVLDFASR